MKLEQGRGGSARRLCLRKRVKRLFPRVQRKRHPRPAAVQPRAVPRLLLRVAGPKASAGKSSKNKRSAMPSKTAKTSAKAAGSKATASKAAHKAPPKAAAKARGQAGCPQARRRQAGRKAGGDRAQGRGAEEGPDPAPGLQDQRIRGLSRPRRRPDPRHRGPGDRRRQA